MHNPEIANNERRLNDSLRRTFIGGLILTTSGVRALTHDMRSRVLAAVREQSEFPLGKGPYGQHDFGSVEIGGQRFFWKIDCYDQSGTCTSPDPSDPDVTRRVLTIMEASEL